MKIFRLVPITGLIILLSTPAWALDYPLGVGHIGAKFDALSFSADFLETNEIDKGVYLGVEGYAGVSPNIYLGAEVGYAHPTGSNGGVSTELTYMPFEFNAKYVDEAAPNILFAGGGGVSINYAEETTRRRGVSSNNDDWMLGAQFFGEINYTSGSFFAGFNLKYQFTENFEPSDPATGGYSYTNWRVGGQAGITY